MTKIWGVLFADERGKFHQQNRIPITPDCSSPEEAMEAAAFMTVGALTGINPSGKQVSMDWTPLIRVDGRVVAWKAISLDIVVAEMESHRG